MRNAITWLLLVVMLHASASNAEETMPTSFEFALDLYHQLDAQPGNLFFSPLSIRAALAMASAGAKGKTLQEMNETLRLSGNDPHAVIGKMLRDLARESQDTDPKLTLRIANALWGQRGYPFDPAYIKLVREQYLADARSVDFSNEPAARKLINDWVEEKTSRKISELIPAGALHSDTRLVLTNAVYFNARWDSEFNKDTTTDQPFHVSMDKTTTVSMMRQTSHFEYAQTADFEAIDLPYAGYDASMLILLPKSGDGIAAMEKNLTAGRLGQAIRDLKIDRVDLSMPRFRIEQACSLADTLRAMGMKLAFDPDHADFSAMCTAEPLFIGDVLHKAFVRVDEEGTEAAAATAVVMRAGAARLPEEIIRVQVDHPFIFVIRHRKTGEILFIGRMLNPAA